MQDKRISFAGAEFESYSKTTKRSKFLCEMDRIIPWTKLLALIEPHYPKGLMGRPPIRLEMMLRIHFLQQWFNLSDPAVEEALNDSVSMRAFAQVDLGNAAAPDETTICKFRHLLEKKRIGKAIFDEVLAHLRINGIKISNGTIVDATIIAAPSSTKNKDKARDPEMHQTRKGNQWYFGMKAHIGIDSKEKITHSLETTAANVHDSKVLSNLLHGEETRVWGDSAYAGQRDVIRAKAPDALDFTQDRAYRNNPLSEKQKKANKYKSSTRSRVEHVFGIMKGQFRFRKVRYRGLTKNTNVLYVLFALANIVVQKRRLLAAA